MSIININHLLHQPINNYILQIAFRFVFFVLLQVFDVLTTVVAPHFSSRTKKGLLIEDNMRHSFLSLQLQNGIQFVSTYSFPGIQGQKYKIKLFHCLGSKVIINITSSKDFNSNVGVPHCQVQRHCNGGGGGVVPLSIASIYLK